MSGQDDIFIASSLIADTPEKEKENTAPDDTPVAKPRSGDRGSSRSARKSLLGRRRPSIGRRLSGFGGGGFDPNTDDQAKLTSMYSSIIKLNSENKITRDKCWGLHLIDYMDKVILDEGGQAGGSRVNFQKASCTLDASVKIYSHRVDATHMISFSLLENLSRTDGDKANNGSGAPVGSSERSTRLGVHETLKSASQLNQSEMDRAFEVDPMFHKMSKIFDEAGSKGMLLNNLNVGNGCKVSFDSEVKGTPRETETIFVREEEGKGSEKNQGDDPGCKEACGVIANVSKGGSETVEEGKPESLAATVRRGMVDVSGLRTKLTELCDDLSTLPLCPQLGEIRGIIAEVEGDDSAAPGERQQAAAVDDSDSDGGDGGGFHDVPGEDNAYLNEGGPDVNGGHQQQQEPDDPFLADTGECLVAPPRTAFGADGGGGLPSFVGANLSVIGLECGNESGCEWDGGFDGRGSSLSGAAASAAACGPRGIEDRLCDDLKIVNDDYAFYESGALAAAASANNWAGASHWKFVGVKKKLPTRLKRGRSTLGVADGEALSEREDGDDDGENGALKTKGKRKPPAIDFDGPAVPASALSAPKATATSRPKKGSKKVVDKTLLSQDYVARAKKDAEAGTSRFVLPENAGFKPKDLAELFLRPGAITKRWLGLGLGAPLGDGTRAGVGGALGGFHEGAFGGGGFGGDDGLLFSDTKNNTRAANDGYGDGAPGGDDDDDDDGFHFGGGFGDEETEGGNREGGIILGADGVFVDDFKADGLLSAERKVEKIDVTYARKAKRVDVRRLKGDLWRKIDSFHLKKMAIKEEQETSGSAYIKTEVIFDINAINAEATMTAKDGEGAVQPSSPSEAPDMTFSDIILDVSSTEEQSGVTVPFYFICILHLANEKGLRLEGRQDLLDFSVSSDPC